MVGVLMEAVFVIADVIVTLPVTVIEVASPLVEVVSGYGKTPVNVVVTMAPWSMI